MPEETFKHWKVDQQDNGIVWLGMDVENNSTNVLSATVLAELYQILSKFSKKPPAGIAITSNKDNGFIAGADVKEFTQISNQQEALELVQFGQNVFKLLDKMPCATIAVVNGFCMGGGLELALACDYRVALKDSKTRLSLPEVRLGIHPGYGGTVRILRHVNPLIAMDLMLTGRSVSAGYAKKIGLIDDAIPMRLLRGAADKILLNKPNKKKAPKVSKILNNKLIRPIIAMQMRKQVAKKAKPEHYPAPYAIINHWLKFYGNEDKMLQHEAQSVAALSTTDAARNLVRVFLLQDELKALATSNPEKKDEKIKHVHIIGAGVMGGDIATWCVSQGLQVTLQDLKAESLAKAKQRAYSYFKKRLKKPLLIKIAMDRFALDINGYGIQKADIVIEAIFENKEAKRDLYTSIEPKLKKGALIVTNTSSIEIEQLCDAITDPTRLVGLHFFNPVTKMPLIEIVNGVQTDPKIAQRAINFAKQIGKLPLPTKSTPGFLVNRILTPYMVEAGLLHETGHSIKDIDHAAKEFGMPMGPIELADTVGLDVGFHVAKLLSGAYGYNIPSSFEVMVNKGQLGKKSGQGFYTWKKGKKISPKEKSTNSDNKTIQDRLILRFLNEAVACHREGVVANKDLLDAGIIFGTGFAPFRGGPINYIETMGAAAMHRSLSKLNIQHGDRYSPDSGWQNLRQ
ncbi:MAG: 3-hydroxyacyl-CoA dehydrogenase NAD-binding domain-containing protein [Gammaproteobacteria bacterium]